MLSKLVLLTLVVVSTVFAEPQVGDKAVDFTLPSLTSEKTVKMADYSKGVVLFNVWASWCKGCKKEMPFFHKLGKKYKSQGFTVIAVNIDKKASKANKFLSKLNDNLDEKAVITFAYDKEKSLPEICEAKAVPFSQLIKDGKIIKVYLGSFDEDNEHELIADIEAALK